MKRPLFERTSVSLTLACFAVATTIACGDDGSDFWLLQDVGNDTANPLADAGGDAAPDADGRGDADGGDTVSIRIEIYAQGTGLPSLPADVAANVQELVITSYQGTEVQEQRRVDVGEVSTTLPSIPFGDDFWLSVEAVWTNPECADTCATARNGMCEDGERAESPGSVDAVAATCLTGTDCGDCGLRPQAESRLASGATARFDVNGSEAEIRADVFMTPPGRFSPAWRLDLNNSSTPESLYELTEQGRAGFAVATLPESGGLVLAGGADLDPTSPERLDGTAIVGVRDTLQYFDPATGSFYIIYDEALSGDGPTAALRLPQGFAFGTATAIDEEHILLFGGLKVTQAGQVRFLEANQQALLLTLTGFAEGRIEPITTPTSGGRAFHTATLVQDDTIIIAGGVGGTYETPFYPAKINIARFEDGTITIEEAFTQLNTPRAMHTADYFAENDHGVLIAGGRTAQGLAQNSEVLYLDSSGTLQRDVVNAAGDQDMAQPRFGHTTSTYRCLNDPEPYLAVVGGYTVAETGGLLNGSAPTNTVEIYRPNALVAEGGYRFENLPSTTLRTGRAFASVVALPISADLLVVGGIGPDGQPLASAERLYNTDWAKCSVLEGGPVPQLGMPNAHAYGAATVLPNQLVLVTGGFDGVSSRDNSVYYNTDDYSLIADFY